MLSEILHPFLPAPTPGRVLGFLGGIVALGLLLWAANRLTGKPPAPPALRTPEDDGQRRGDFRVPLGTAARILPAGEALPLDAILNEFSAGGATVSVGRSLPPGSRAALGFSACGESFERLPVEIIRCEGSNAHCRFLGLSSDEERRLLRAVAIRERERAKSG